ncbi:hypothetical protein GCM10011519_01500 [Marmoricola endophyticus]|uniref:Septum formation-related domain-containing protein n=1 Tax=Marmoricola endophyticus TaxID=2040280 RepID=A0A917BA81_9ACTN|nr:septum formation family protein [Marmoricola endophyticus]GGF31841.1 hypothetical protein GCM10011519_01500 [Marmoricola endophyticus]
MSSSPASAASLIATTLALTVLLGACADGGDDDRIGERSAGTAAPKAGECRDLTAEDLAQSSDDTPVVACEEVHTAQTFAVGEFPDAVAAAGYDARVLGRYMYDTCGTAYLRFLGGDDSAALRSLFGWAWFRPSPSDWKAGKRWYRCDLVGGPGVAAGADSGAKAELTALPTTARGYLAGDPTTSPHQEWTLCARGTTFKGSAKVPCSTDHDWRAVTTIKLGGPRDRWIGERLAQVRSSEYCSDSVRAYLKYPVEDFDYATTVLGQAEWQTGNRRSVCWARTTT